MSSRIFDRDTILDLTVNVIPLVILAVFILVFIVYSPGSYGTDLVAMTIQFAIVGTTFVGLAVLTYYAGRAIAGEEKRLDIHAQTATYDPEAETSIPQDAHDDEAAPEAELGDEAGGTEDDPELPDDA